MGAIEPQFYASLLDVMGIVGERLPDQNDRAACPEMRNRFAKVFATRTRDEWVVKAAGRDACLAAVLKKKRGLLEEAPSFSS